MHSLVLRDEEAAALQRATGALVAIGDDGCIAFANDDALWVLGWDHNLVGLPMSAIVPRRDRPRHSDAFTRFVASLHPSLSYPKAQRALAQDGTERDVQVAVHAYRRPDASLFLCGALALADEPPPDLEALGAVLRRHGYERVGQPGSLGRLPV